MCYTRTVFLLCLSLLASRVTAHMIEVPAGKKECFFEDLHVNDKVCGSLGPQVLYLRLLDDSNLSSRGWGPP